MKFIHVISCRSFGLHLHRCRKSEKTEDEKDFWER